MRTRASTVLAVAALVLTSVAAGAAPAVDASVLVGSSRITAASIRDHVEALANPAWGGRALASPGADSAAAYIRERFRAVGLDPGTKEGTYYISFPVPTAARVEGVIGLRDRRRGYTFGLDWSPLGFTSKGHALAPLAVAGYGITAPEAGYDDYAGLEVSGKMVFVLAGEPLRAKQTPLLGTGPAYHADPFVKALNARRHGALGVLIAGPPPGSGGTSPVWRVNQEQGYPDAGIPACHMSWVAAESLLSGSGLDLGAMRRGQPVVADHFSADSGCDSVEVISDLRRLDGIAIDIVGRLPGQTEGTVIVAAAYDGWGGGPDNSSRVLHPGAGDNAAGVALLLELAGAMRGVLPPDHTILFVAYAGRVFDAIGIAPLVERMTAPGERVVAFVDLGGFGAKPAERLIVSGTGSASGWRDLLDGVRAVLPGAPEVRRVEATPSWGALPRWKAVSVPAILVSTGGTTRFGTPQDTPGELDPVGLARLGRYTYGIVRALASEKTGFSGRGTGE
jgi:hypothetical protein